jgi:hypothetical protein
MLYHMTRFYDEWPGEDYAGSSCRGAMKGWHRHGICTDEIWPYRDPNKTIRYIEPTEGWADDAARRPLGAYYRIEKDSIVAMQSAMRETGAVFVSANIHEGWYTGLTDTLSVIPRSEVITGGHAFALVGYLPEGFLVQNSWGDSWGRRGFAVLGYEDWVTNGHDAWVSVMGAPMRVTSPPQSFSNISLTKHATGLQAVEGNRRARCNPGAKAAPTATA